VQPTSAKRPSFPMVIKGELPMITFAPSVAEELARRGSAATAASVGPALRLPAQTQVARPAAGVTPLAGGSDVDRDEILKRHFELMQEFLGNQTRVASLLGDHLKGRRD
jgi:hypothetical protein